MPYCPGWSQTHVWTELILLSQPPEVLGLQANSVFLVATGFLHSGEAGLEPPTSGDPSTLASQSAGITGVSHHTWPIFFSF